MGDTGPCGPCSEIHIDCRPDAERKKIPGKELVNKDHPQVIEIWNNVFIQYNRKKDGTLEPLAQTHVDTGMGLERLVRILQGKTSNYDTDIFSGTIAATERLTHQTYDGSDSKAAIAFRVIADHIRAIGFCIADGQLPSNTGAGYVIRRILRRAVRYYYSCLGHHQPLLHKLIPVLADQFAGVFPELKQQQDFVVKVVKEEEEAFLRTLDKGLKRMDELMRTSQQALIPGKAAFELYDTYGFPIDLTRLIAQENQLTVDEIGFETEMQQQKNRSRAATSMDTGDWTLLKENSSSAFIGYQQLEVQTELLRYRTIQAKGKKSFQVVLEQTPFYAESGGQIGDAGVLEIQGKAYEVTTTKKENDLFVHFLDQLPQEPKGIVTARVNRAKRSAIAVHHSATHLLHAALRKVLGQHVAQKGSLVTEEYLRFDFSHFAKLTEEELNSITMMVNQKIRENLPVLIQEMPKEDALRKGAMALFGEKYGQTVRVVIIDPDYSIELCGGTHVRHTGELGFFSIKSESAIAAGVRRIEAVCGEAATDFVESSLHLLEEIRKQFKHPADLLKAIEQQQSEMQELRKRNEAIEAKLLVTLGDQLLTQRQTIQTINFLGTQVEVPGPDTLKKLCLYLKQQLPDHVILLTASIDLKPFVALGIADALVKTRSLDANKLIKEKIAPLIAGGGGGQPTLATAGGQDLRQLPAVIESIRQLL
jgi:alanyl-tRNA synthetase